MFDPFIKLPTVLTTFLKNYCEGLCGKYKFSSNFFNKDSIYQKQIDHVIWGLTCSGMLSWDLSQETSLEQTDETANV